MAMLLYKQTKEEKHLVYYYYYRLLHRLSCYNNLSSRTTITAMISHFICSYVDTINATYIWGSVLKYFSFQGASEMEVFYLSTTGSTQITYTQALISLVYDKSMPTNLNTSIKKIVYKKKHIFQFFVTVEAEKRDPTVTF